MIFIRSALFFAIMVVTAVFFSILAVTTFPFRFATRFRIISGWARMNMWTLKVLCGLRYEVRGKENIPDDTAIAFVKHQSAWETIAMQCILPAHTWVLKRELMYIPFFGWGLAMLHSIAIDRASGRKALQQLVEQGKQRLDSGHWVMIFPEGTRMPPGKRRRFGYGGAKLAEQSGHVVVPVAHNAGDYWPRRQFKKKPGVIQVCIGPPIETKGKTAAEINDLAEQWIADAMTEITGVVEELVERKKK